MSKFLPNSFQVPNIIIDEYMGILSASSFKCYLLIVRKTMGWNKSSDGIAQSQIMEATGIKSNNTVRSALNDLVAYKLITESKFDGRYSTFQINKGFANIVATPSKIAEVKASNTPSKIADLPPQKLQTQNTTNTKDTKQKTTNTKVVADVKTPADSTTVFNEYVIGMKQRYGEQVTPARNAKINKLLNVMIERIGLEQAVSVARNYPLHQNNWYVQKVHAVDYMVQDCEALSIQVQSGQMVTRQYAYEQDQSGNLQNKIALAQLDPRANEVF